MADSAICFKRVDYSLDNQLNYIETGDIGLPDIQRSFVWKNTKVRELFDSMYHGFPVGYFLCWANQSDDKSRSIGSELSSRHMRSMSNSSICRFK